MGKRLIASDEAVTSAKQHTTPCSDCPWSRQSLPGWLGGATPQEWVQTAHSDAVIQCHTISNQQCAGAAIYRRNVCKSARPPNLELPKDTTTVFGWPTEFVAHHERKA